MLVSKGPEEGEVGIVVEGPLDAPFVSKGLNILGKIALRRKIPEDGGTTTLICSENELPKIARRFEKAAVKEYEHGLLPNSQTYEVMASRIRGRMVLRTAQTLE